MPDEVRQNGRDVRLYDDLAVLGLESIGDDPRERQLVVELSSRGSLEAYRVRLNGVVRVARHQRDHAARIDSSAQEGADRHIADHLVAYRSLDLGARRLDPVALAQVFIYLRRKTPEALSRELAVLDEQGLPGLELANPFEQRARGAHIAEGEKLGQRFRVELSADVRQLQERLGLRGEGELPLGERVVKRFDAEGIARNDQPLGAAVPERQGKHALELLQERIALLLVEMDDDLGIAARGELVARLLETGPQLAEVVDLAVADDDEIAVLVADRLMAAGDVDDRQPPHAEEQLIVDEATLVVGSSMQNGAAHAREHGGIGPSRTAQTQHAVDSAHDTLPANRGGGPGAARPSA